MIKRATEKMATIIGTSISMHSKQNEEACLLAIGSLLSNQQWSMNSNVINDYEYKIFSQFGDDGIIQYLIKNIKIENEIFIEFGVGDYLESNTRFLLMHNNWTGFVMDESEAAMNALKSQYWFWKYCLTCRNVFIDKDNINELLNSTGFSNIGLINIDLDGNDYHVFANIDLSKLNPSIISIEYNSVFGKDRPLTVPYDKNFVRTKAHFSNLFVGASLAAVNYAASQKGYSLVGSNLAGNNAYFVRNDLLNDKVRNRSVSESYKESKFRESRNRDQSLSYLAGSERIGLIKGLEVLNVETNRLEKL